MSALVGAVALAAAMSLGLLTIAALILKDARRRDLARMIGSEIQPPQPWPKPGPITTPIRLDDAARLYRFVSGHAGVEDCAATRCDDLRGLAWAADFDTFCAYNRMRVYEEVIR